VGGLRIDTKSSSSPRVFVSYRRDDAGDAAGRIYDHLVEQYGAESVFIDIDTIPAGADFVQVISEAVASCDVLIAVIGKRWLTVKDGSGGRRIDDPLDFVHLEIATALSSGVQVVPALVQRIVMPKETQLPAPLRALARRNAINLSHEHFGEGMHRLIADLDVTRESVRYAREQGAEREQLEREAAEREAAAREQRHAERVKQWSQHELIAVEQTLTQTGAVLSVAFSPDGRLLATGGNDRAARVWDAATGSQLQRLTHASPEVTSVVFSGDGQHLLTGNSLAPTLWDIESGQRVREYKVGLFSRKAYIVLFSPDGQVVAGAYDGVAVWDTDKRKGTTLPKTALQSIKALAFSPDGKRLAAGGADGLVTLWNVGPKWERLRTITNASEVTALAFSPDGRFLAIGTTASTTRVFEVAGWDYRRTLSHDGPPTALVFSPDSSMLFTAAAYDPVCVWNTENWNALVELDHESAIHALACSPSGQRLAVGCEDKTTRIWTSGA
jgi:WD40 repeat protein